MRPGAGAARRRAGGPGAAAALTEWSWPADAASLAALQEALAAAAEAIVATAPWRPPGGLGDTVLAGLALGGCFVCFERGGPGTPGAAGDRSFAAAATVRGRRVAGLHVVEGVAGAPYQPGLLALREGSLLAAAVDGLADRPDVLLVNATGVDHPRRAGLAIHLGAALDLPTVGVTDRLLTAEAGRAEAVETRPGRRSVYAHPGWRTDLTTAVAVVRAAARRARTPEPIRQARQAARRARTAWEDARD